MLRQLIDDRTARIAVVGLGYVGLPVACAFAEAGFRVTGIDADPVRVAAIQEGACPIANEPGLAILLQGALERGALVVTAEDAALHLFDAAIICVQTPVDAGRRPDYRALRLAVASVGAHLRPGRLVVVESTLAPGTMQRVVEPELRRASGLRANLYHLAHCPERLAPGKLLYNLTHVPRVIGGVTEAAGEVAAALYASICCAPLHRTDAATAEVVKTAENAYRDVQIAFANEVALICEDQGVDAWRVRELVNTCPGRDMHAPGPGVGGPCLSKDSWLLFSGHARLTGASVVREARVVNDDMPRQVYERAARALEEQGSTIVGATVALLGCAYRENTDDARGSPATALAQRLFRSRAIVRTHDPLVPGQGGDWRDAVRGADCAVLLAGHDAYGEIDLDEMRRLMRVPVLVDTRAFWRREEADNAGLIYYRLGAG